MNGLNEKRPRHYAFEICCMSRKEDRIEALSKVPDHLRELTKIHVINTFNLRRTRYIAYHR